MIIQKNEVFAEIISIFLQESLKSTNFAHR